MRKKLGLLMILFCAAFLAYAPIKADAAWKQADNGNYYYYNEKGKLQKNKWIGNYYVNEHGMMVTNQWIGKWFVGEDGKWIPNFKGGWQRIHKKWYYYTKRGKKVTGLKLINGKLYYLDENSGIMQRGKRTIDGSTYFFEKDGHAAKGWKKVRRKWYFFNKKDYKMLTGTFIKAKKKIYYVNELGEMLHGLQGINGGLYFFNEAGVRQNGWHTVTGDELQRDGRYYFHPINGRAVTGMTEIGSNIYYFNESGILQRNCAVEIEGRIYNVDRNGICTLTVNIGEDISDKMLFFTYFESGADAYAQTGGDAGKAYGKYQFDYRYSLAGLVNFCYKNNPIVFADFKPFLRWEPGNIKWVGNKKFAAAWKKIYDKYPDEFRKFQDAYAKQQYYDPTERQLKDMGILLEGRSDVVKGAVFSYAIQHGGGYTTCNAVQKAKITNNTSDEDFIKKLYKYRIKMFPLYTTRYTQEKMMALSLLHQE